MKAINDYLQAYAVARGISSDYAIAKDLGVTRQAVSKYRHDRAYPDFETAWRIADAIGCDPSEVMAAAELARAKRAHDSARASVWQSRLKQIAGGFLLVFCGFFWSAPASAAVPGAVGTDSAMY